MSGPYTQQQYEKAKASLADPSLNEESRRIRAQRIAEFEGKKPGMGNLRAMEGAGGPLEVKTEPAPEMPTLSEVGSGMDSYLSNSTSDTAQVIKAAMPYEEVERRQQAVDMTKKLSRDESLKTASKLKVFADPPEYTPPKPLPGMLGSVALAATNFPARYFEPTIKEFKEVLGGNNRVAEKIREQYPDVADLAELSDANLLHSDAYRAYADARWQRELAKAIKEKRGIIRTAYSDKDWMSGGKPAKPDSVDSLADVMDMTMAFGTGVLQGGTAGGYDLALSGDTNKRRAAARELAGDENFKPLTSNGQEFRDAGRGSRDRNPRAAGLGEIVGALHPRSLGSKVAGLAGKVGAPSSLVGRGIKAGVIGAGTAVLDENMRAAADLAADAMDAEMTVAETLSHITQNLPGVDPMTATIGGGLGVGGDLIGAGAQAWSRGMQNSDDLRVPLKDYERAGGKVGPSMGPKISKDAIALRNKAEARGADPAGYLAEKIKEPLARQRLLEQEEMYRGIEQATNRAQARLDGAESTFGAANRIRALGEDIPMTPVTRGIKKMLKEFATDVGRTRDIDAEKLDGFIEIAGEQAGYASKRGEPTKYWDDVGKILRDLRDEFKFRDEATVVTNPPDKGVFTAEPEVTIKTPEPKQVGAVRDRYGNVKAVEDYSAEKLRQSRIQRFYEESNERMGLPRKLEPESMLSEPYVSKGVFDPKTVQQVAESLPVKAKLDKIDDDKFVNAIRGASKRNNFRSREEIDSLASRSELESLGGRAGLNLGPKLRLIRELESAGELKKALGGAMEGVSNRGNFGFDTLKRLGYRLIPTLESIGSGLPESALQLSDVGKATSRFKEFLSKAKKPARDPVEPSFDRVPEGDGKPIVVKPKNSGIIPDLKGVELRGGLPARAVGPVRDEEESVPGFTREETDFWLKVIDKMAKERPK